MLITKSKLSGNIIVFLLVLSAVLVFTPILKNGLLLMIVGLLLLGVIFSYLRGTYYKKHPRLMLFTFLYLFICIIYRFIGVSSAPPGTLALHILFFLFLLFMIILPYGISLKQNNVIFYATILVVLFNILDNIRLCLTYPEIYVLVNRDMDPLGENLNIGSSKFYNALFFFFTISFFGFLNSNKRETKYIMLICVLLTSLFIFVFCLKAAIIVFTCLSTFLLFFAKKAQNIRSFLLRIFLPAMIVYGLVNIFSDYIIESISNIFTSERLVNRLVLLIDSDSASTGTVEARENLWLMSINTWTDSFTNFLFGIGDHRANWSAGQTASDTGIGQHSDIFDSFARYGILGVLILLQILYLGFKYLLSLFGKQYKIQLFVIIAIFLLFGLTKGVFQPDISFVLFILLPVMWRKGIFTRS